MFRERKRDRPPWSRCLSWCLHTPALNPPSLLSAPQARNFLQVVSSQLVMSVPRARERVSGPRACWLLQIHLSIRPDSNLYYLAMHLTCELNLLSRKKYTHSDQVSRVATVCCMLLYVCCYYRGSCVPSLALQHASSRNSYMTTADPTPACTGPHTSSSSDKE